MPSEGQYKDNEVFLDFAPKSEEEMKEIYKKAEEADQRVNQDNKSSSCSYQKTNIDANKKKAHTLKKAIFICSAVAIAAGSIGAIRGSYIYRSSVSSVVDAVNEAGYTKIDDYYEFGAFTNIDIELENTYIDIYDTSSDSCNVSCDILYGENGSFTCNIENINGVDTLVIRATGQKTKDSVSFNDYSHEQEVYISIPETMICGDINITTTNQQVYISDVVQQTGTLKINNSNADVSCYTNNVDNMVINTSNGEVNIMDSQINSLDIVTSNGYVSAYNCVFRDNVSAVTSNESINMDIWGMTSGNISLTTSNNDISVDLPLYDENYRTTAKTSNGKIYTNTQKGDNSYTSSITETYGTKTGDINMELNTSNSNIYIDFGSTQD